MTAKKNLYWTALLSIIAISLCCILAVAACSREKSGAPKKGKLSVKETKDGVEVTSADGTLSIAGNEKTGHIKIKTEQGEDIEVRYRKDRLADGFPPDIPIYEPATVKMSQAFQGHNAIATLSTKDSPGTVAQFYKERLPQKGFTMGDDISVGDLVLLQGIKENVKLNISLKKTDNETTINLAMTENK